MPDAVDVTERSGHQMGQSKQAREAWTAIIEATHAIRMTRLRRKEKKPSLEDTRFTVALHSIALFGEAIIGAGTLSAAGTSGDDRTRRRFRAWFAKLVERQLEDPD